MSQPQGIKFYLWLFCICCSLMGVQFVYSIQFALGAPLFQNKLMLSPSTVSIILATAGPISGFIVQPIVGVLSDSCTHKWGRRRIFILVGSLCCCIGMLLIAFSVDLGNAFGDKKDGLHSSDHIAGITIAILGFWIMNLFVNTIQGPARAIVVDIVPADRQQDGNAMASGVMGMAAIIANVIGASLFTLPAPYRNLFIIGVVAVILSTIPTYIVAKEERYVAPETNGERPKWGSCNAFYKIYYAFRTIPRKMIIIVVVFFFSWCAYSPYMIYITTYFSDNIYEGGDNTDLGVEVGMYGLAIFAVFQWIFSLVLAPFIRCWKVNFVYAVTQLLATVCYIAFLFIESLHTRTQEVAITYLVMALLAVNFTTINAVPYGLVRGVVGNKDSGLYMGVLNAASVVAQTFANLLTSPILKATAEKTPIYESDSDSPTESKQNVVYAIIFGGIFSVFATICALFLKDEEADAEATAAEKEPLIVNEDSQDSAHYNDNFTEDI